MSGGTSVETKVESFEGLWYRAVGDVDLFSWRDAPARVSNARWLFEQVEKQSKLLA